jgi:GNAT superfamily N-acetyltransferase
MEVDPENLEWRATVQPSDCASVLSIVASSGFFTPEEVRIAGELVEERLAKGPASGYHFLFAEQARSVLGYTCFGPIPGTRSSFDLYWIAVRQERRGAGLGRKLLARSEEAMARMGGERVYVETSSRLLYAPTRVFYTSCGYRQEALLTDFYAPGDSKLMYVKVLGGDRMGPLWQLRPDLGAKVDLAARDAQTF